MYHSRNTSGRAGECVKAGLESFYFHIVFRFCSDKCFLECRPAGPPLAGFAPWNVKRFLRFRFLLAVGSCHSWPVTGLMGCAASSTKWKLLLVLAGTIRQVGLLQDLGQREKVMA